MLRVGSIRVKDFCRKIKTNFAKFRQFLVDSIFSKQLSVHGNYDYQRSLEQLGRLQKLFDKMFLSVKFGEI